ncbi:MAG: Ig-like domain-containing protein [Verrucomicrobia bacterium]|nr:Ig-like domain-containing protein [Verrucomicrobiota bacterium]
MKHNRGSIRVDSARLTGKGGLGPINSQIEAVETVDLSKQDNGVRSSKLLQHTKLRVLIAVGFYCLCATDGSSGGSPAPPDGVQLTITAPTNEVVIAASSGFTFTTAFNYLLITNVSVKFYVGTNFVGNADHSPFSVVVTNLAEGRYQLNARTDVIAYLGTRVEAPPVFITIGKTNNNPPVVSLKQIEFGVLYLPSVVRLDAQASDSDGYITQVEFYNRTLAFTNLLGVVRSPPFTMIWSNSVTSDGGYFFYARATDNLGTAIQSRDVGIGFTLVQPPNNRPAIDVVLPGEGEEVSLRSPVVIQARARYLDNNINPVDFYTGTNLIGSALGPLYFLIVSNLPPGKHTLSAVARDLQGNEGSGGTKMITIKGVQLSSPKLTSSQGLEFDAQFYPPGSLTLQITTNLVDWVSLSTNRVSGSSFHFADPGSTNYFQRYYRVLLGP